MDSKTKRSENKEFMNDCIYLLCHTNTWEGDKDIPASSFEGYLASTSQIETVKIEEIVGAEYENSLIKNFSW